VSEPFYKKVLTKLMVNPGKAPHVGFYYDAERHPAVSLMVSRCIFTVSTMSIGSTWSAKNVKCKKGDSQEKSLDFLMLIYYNHDGKLDWASH